MKFESVIESEDQLREVYGFPLESSIKKQKSELDQPSIDFINQSPFLCLATRHSEHSVDCSPKGDPEGSFVKILNNKTIAIPDRKGNNRLDGLVNILSDPKVGLLFLIPGRNDTLRLNGRAQLVRDPELLESMAYQGKVPNIAIVIEIDEVFLHCPKALIRAKLWKENLAVDDLTAYIRDQYGQLGTPMSDEEITQKAAEYRANLKNRLY